MSTLSSPRRREVNWLDGLTLVVGVSALALTLHNMIPGRPAFGSLDGQAGDRRALPVLASEDQSRLRDVPSLAVGPRDAPVVVEIFFSYTCAYCLEWAETVTTVQREFPQHVSLSWRHYIPNASVEQRQLHLAAECAGEQQRFVAYHNAVIAEMGRTNTGELWTVAGKHAGMDVHELIKCVRSGRHLSALQAATALGTQLMVDGTPISFVEGVRIDGAVSVEALRDVVVGRLNTKRQALRHDDA